MALARIQFVALFLTIAAGVVYGGQPATTHTNTPLKAEPYIEAETITGLEKGVFVEIISRKGGWYQIKTPDHTGWLKIYSVRLSKTDAAKEKSGDDGIEQAGQLLVTGRSGSNAISASTGIRGLDEENLSEATPDKEALEKMDGLAPTPDEVGKFNNQRKLKSNKIIYFHDIEIEDTDNPKQGIDEYQQHNNSNTLGNDYD
jgi:hypothetical protein